MKKHEVKKELKKFLNIAKKNEIEIATLKVLEGTTDKRSDYGLSSNASLPKKTTVINEGIIVETNRESTPIESTTENAVHESSIAELSQEVIQMNVNLYTKEKAHNIYIDDGPFHINYTINGSHMLINNASGMFSAHNTHHLTVGFERNFEDSVFDATWLHNELYFAAAQKNALYIYNNEGVELHAVRDISAPRLLEFLPYHFLLATACANGRLKYLDTSTGRIVGDVNIKERTPHCLTSNMENGVICLGTQRGSVTMWAPTQNDPLMTVNCHRAGITVLEIEKGGNKMVTCGIDNRLRVFDLRNTCATLKTVILRKAVTCSSLSQTNLLALGGGNNVVVLREFEDIYLSESSMTGVSSLAFCPFQDILAIGHESGVTTIVVPGSARENYDSYENSPFLSVKQRQEIEVKRLLEKIPYDMIGLEKVIGSEKLLEEQ